jgi:uncharacterized protein (TIGR02301 family)
MTPLRTHPKPSRPLLLAAVFSLCLLMPALTAAQQAVEGFADSQEQRPYDDKLFRLAEILGAVHYLRELCLAEEGQMWREQMTALIDAEGTTAKRRARLVRTFNRGYRGYQRTYRTCTRPAILAIDRFMTEGQNLSKTIIRISK